MDKKYRVYVVDADSLDIKNVGDGSDEEIGYSEIRDVAIDYMEGDTIEELTKELVSTLNNSCADNNFYFVCDAENEIILFW
jgi:hypothetical protein